MHKYIFETVDINELINNISQKVTDNILTAVGSHQFSNNALEEPLSRQEAAQYLNISVVTLDKYRSEGRIPYYKTGRTIYFKRNEIDEALSVKLSRRSISKRPSG